MDGATDDAVARLRRTVLLGLLVVGLVTSIFAVIASRPGAAQEQAEDDGPPQVVTSVRPTNEASEGPLRLGRIQVAGRFGDPVAAPDNTAESFERAMDAGVDYVEAPVVMSSDKQLVVLASNELDDITDVASRPEFADRQRVDPEDGTHWFSDDFTLDELRTLRAVEADPELRPQVAAQDGQAAVIALDDLLTQVQDKSTELGRSIGVMVKPFKPSYFRGQGLPLEPAILSALKRSRLLYDPERITVESNDLEVLARMETLAGPNVLTAYVVTTGAGDELGDLTDLPDTLDALAVEAGAFTGNDPCAIGRRVDDAGLALVVFPISYENALLGKGFRKGDDPAARGDLQAQVSGLRDIGTDVILAESPTEVVEAVGKLSDDDVSKCDPAVP